MKNKLIILCIILGALCANAETGQHPDPKLCGNHILPYKASMNVIKRQDGRQVELTITARSSRSETITVELWDEVSNKPIPGTLRNEIKPLGINTDTVINWTLTQEPVREIKAIIKFNGHGNHGHLVVTDDQYKPETITLEPYAALPEVAFKGMKLNRTILLTPSKQ